MFLKEIKSLLWTKYLSRFNVYVNFVIRLAFVA